MGDDIKACTLGMHKKKKGDLSSADLAVAGKLQPGNSAFSVQRPLAPAKKPKKSSYSF